MFDRAVRRWNALSLERRFLIAAALSVGLSMLALGYWVERQIRAGWLQGMAETGAVYLEAILSPHLQVLATSKELPEPQRAAIAALMTDTRLSGRVAMIKIWSPDGRLLFSTRAMPDNEKMAPDVLRRVRTGTVAVEIDDDNQGLHSPMPSGLIEVYAPMYRRGTREIIAIGEFYEFSRALEAEAVRVKYATWFLIINVALIIGVLLFATVKRASRIIQAQQGQLEANLARAAALARRNNALRRSADGARLKAAVLNENYLARVGADLHDGPIQMLSLMMLKLPEESSDAAGPVASQRAELENLIQATLADLRNLSVGLVLPELQTLSLAATISLAVTRHEQLTGTPVDLKCDDLPEQVSEAIKVCVYRITQEALTNAYKHAGGTGQAVQARAQDGSVILRISDGGGKPVISPAASHNSSLGLRGMESRVQAMRGTLSIIRNADGGMEVVARLPIRRWSQAMSDTPRALLAEPAG